MDLRNIDLNLLFTLEALLTECNVTRAARRLHLSQPSVSVRLRKLRQIFGDPLLMSAGGGMQPTARGHAVLPLLRAALADLSEVLQPRPTFDPSSAHGTWHIAAADYAVYSILMACIQTLRKTAPGIRVAVREASHSSMVKLLDTGAIDLGLLALDTAPDRLHHRVLFTEHYVLVARRHHPLLKDKVTLDTLSRLDYVVVSPEGGGFRGATDGALESLGYRRNVVLSVPHFLFVPQVVARTDLVAMLPSRLVTERSDRIRVMEPPVRIPPFEMAIVWHERTHADPRQAWLRELVVQNAKSRAKADSVKPA